ncbi:3-hydroxybutyrate dehydrogenase [Paenibacillus sp. MBLB4367]|uniref:3-hydroxybutyrate dehydrogenase n=1 Tax=Paenibacillus sp. MBLB4367 TaxID=3384767 RepID=UPI003907FC89
MASKRVVLITGAGSGIGRRIGERFAADGAAVVITDLHAKLAVETASELAAGGYTALGFGCDVTREEDIAGAVEAAVRGFGRLDVLVNNAGMQYVSPIEEFPTDMFEKMLRMMLTAPFIAIKHAFPHMKRQRFGRIVNMASINGLIGFSGKSAYNSAKHGLLGLTKVTSLEGAEFGITANAICPGYVDTPLVRNQLADLARVRGIRPEQVLEQVIYPLVPQKRLLDVDEIADCALFLASEQAKGITGQTLVVDGGYTVQ